jgi:hypothetical protein
MYERGVKALMVCRGQRYFVNAKKNMMTRHVTCFLGALLLSALPVRQGWSAPENTKENRKAETAMQQTLLAQSTPQQIALPIPDAQEFGASLAGTPCRVINPIGRKMLYQPPGLGHPVLVLNSCVSEGAGSAVFVDFVKGKTTVVPLPHGSGGWDIIETEPGKLLFESLESLWLITVDTTNGNYRVESSIKVPGVEYAWSFSKGADGQIYFGSYPTGHAYRFDPKTQEVTDLGYIGPEGNLYVRHVAVDASGLLLCDVIVSKPSIVAYDPVTKKQTEVAPGKSAPLISIGGRVFSSLDSVLHEFDAPSMNFVAAKIPPAPAGLVWRNISPNSTPERLLLIANDSNWYEVKPGAGPDAAPRQVWNINLKAGGVVGFVGDDQLVVFRGQEYAVAKTLDQNPQWKLATDNAIPVSMHFLRADPKGGVTGGPAFGQTLFRFDPARKLDQNTGQVVDSGGEVYQGQWIDDKFHFVAYSGGYQAVWDPEQPWDQLNNKNPHTFVRYDTPEFGTVIRPIGGMVQGPGKKLYTGWSGQYGVTNGALTEFDPATLKTRHWKNDLFAENMSVGKVVSDGKYVYGLTSNEFSGILPEHKPLVFWVFDPATEKVVFKKTLAVTVGVNLVCVPQTNRVWLADPSGVHRFDVGKLEFVQTLNWPESLGKVADINSADARGSNAWLATDTTIVKLGDGTTPRLKAQFKMKQAANIAAGYDGKLYYTQKAELWSAPLK